MGYDFPYLATVDTKFTYNELHDQINDVLN